MNAPIPPAWVPLIDDYLLSLAAAGQSEATVALRRGQLNQVTRSLGVPVSKPNAVGLSFDVRLTEGTLTDAK